VTDVGPRWPEGWSISRVGYGDPEVALLVEQVQAFYVERYGGPDETPLDPLMFQPPHGSFFIGHLDGTPVATGAWRRTSAAVVPGLPSDAPLAEVKRMFVVPAAQRRGLARLVLAHLERSAAEAGVRALVLETGAAQPEAIALYTSSGYQPVPGFGHYRDSPLSRCFGKVLQIPPVDGVPPGPSRR
jgi:GNAT superfamily N-acetyltransferase